MRVMRALLVGVAAVGAISIAAAVLSSNLTRRDVVFVPTPGGTMTEGIVGAPRAINPLLCPQDEAARDVCTLVFRGLTRLGEDGEAQPDLAESWSISPDGTTYTFRLRGDARWEDGTPVTTEDVRFTLELVRDPAFPGPRALHQAWSAITTTVVDSQTVQFQLARPFAPFLNYTALGLLPSHLLSGTVATQLEALPFNQNPRGNGAWRVTEVDVSGGRITRVVLVPSETFAGSKPQLARLVLRFYPNSSALFEAFQAGEVDSAAGLSLEDVKRAEALPDAVIYAMPQARYVMLLFNLRRDSGVLPLSEQPVREALRLALDREAIVREALEGRAMVAHTPLPPNSWAWLAEVQLPPRDLKRARALLEGAGYSLKVVAPFNSAVWQKEDEPLGFTLLVPDNPLMLRVGQVIARQWRELDVPVSVVPAPNIVPNFLATHQFQAALVETLLDGDPDPFPLWHGSRKDSGKNFAGWDDPEVNEWLLQARQTLDRNTRFELYRRFQQRFAQAVPAIPLFYPPYYYVVSARVRGVQVTPITYPSDRFRTLHAWMINVRPVSVVEATATARAPLP
ncbi:MAG: peptide ABC transporter substrate-binding protein [Thermoflexales bacterium]|nr:peptide ABC transporter substrate-binding protein [Thermoflexales bacterium]